MRPPAEKTVGRSIIENDNGQHVFCVLAAFFLIVAFFDVIIALTKKSRVVSLYEAIHSAESVREGGRFMTLSDKLYKILIKGDSWKTILGGFWVTIQISLFALLLGTVVGALLCLLRTRKNPIAKGFASVYIAIMRGTPVLMLLLLLYYGIFARAGLTPITVAVLTFALNVSAHVAELLRSALEAADKGQAEAARTLGFSAWSTFRLVTLPQVLRIAKPVYQSTIVNLIQWTSVVGYVTITDLTRVINNTASRTMQPLLTIIIGMLIYLALSYIIFGLFALSDKIKAKRRGAAV